MSSESAEPVGHALPAPVKAVDVLEKLAVLPISTWRYEWEAADVRHIGPMAQDWHATFGLGVSDTTIACVDANGILLVAVQALHRRVQELQAQIDQLTSSSTTVPPT
jgi:hypothetical protein